MRVEGTDIYIIRGDSATIDVSCQDESGTPLPLQPGDTIYLTVKTHVSMEDKVLQKTVTAFTDGVAHISLLPEDTKALDFVAYVYDVQLTQADGTVTTIIPPSRFVVEGEVTYE